MVQTPICHCARTNAIFSKIVASQSEHRRYDDCGKLQKVHNNNETNMCILSLLNVECSKHTQSKLKRMGSDHTRAQHTNTHVMSGSSNSQYNCFAILRNWLIEPSSFPQSNIISLQFFRHKQRHTRALDVFAFDIYTKRKKEKHHQANNFFLLRRRRWIVESLFIISCKIHLKS